MIEALIVLVILGFIAYMVDAHIPMSPPFKSAFRFIVVLLLCLWLLDFTGIYSFSGLRR